MKKHKYSTSNLIGSYILYSVEMGIPFFLYGEKATLHDLKNPLRPKRKSINPKVEALFKVPPHKVEKITIKQKKFIESEAGVNDCINPRELRKILLKTFFSKCIFRCLWRILLLPKKILEKYISTFYAIL